MLGTRVLASAELVYVTNLRTRTRLLARRGGCCVRVVEEVFDPVRALLEAAAVDFRIDMFDPAEDPAHIRKYSYTRNGYKVDIAVFRLETGIEEVYLRVTRIGDGARSPVLYVRALVCRHGEDLR